MRKFLFILIFTAPFMGFSQVQDPVKWTFSSKKVSVDVYEVHLTATMDRGWHTYSQATPDGGPAPTAIAFSKNPLLSLSGNVKEIGKLEEHHEPLFGVDVKQYSNKVDFVQSVKVKSNAKTVIKGSVEYMVCDATKCLPPKTVEFSISIK
ncbi:MAG: protein-disulfide reductase DsbD domain-containing protein [Chitinophagales bacterium]